MFDCPVPVKTDVGQVDLLLVRRDKWKNDCPTFWRLFSMIKMCCFIIFTDINFVNNYFNGFKNIGFHWCTLSLIITVNQETFRTYTWIYKTICISKQITFWRHFGKGMQCGIVLREMLTELFVRRYFQQNELLIYFFLISVT